MPSPDFTKWSKSRQEEIFLSASSDPGLHWPLFAFEIESAIRYLDELHIGGLKCIRQGQGKAAG